MDEWLEATAGKSFIGSIFLPFSFENIVFNWRCNRKWCWVCMFILCLQFTRMQVTVGQLATLKRYLVWMSLSVYLLCPTFHPMYAEHMENGWMQNPLLDCSPTNISPGQTIFLSVKTKVLCTTAALSKNLPELVIWESQGKGELRYQSLWEAFVWHAVLSSAKATHGPAVWYVET